MESQLIYGRHPVRLALERAPQDALELWVLDDAGHKDFDAILKLVEQHGIATNRAARKTLDNLVHDARHQGVVLRRRVAKPHTENDLPDLLDDIQGAPLILILDGVQDPHNLGACLRTADATGVDLIIIPRDRAVGLTPVVAKAASGAADTVPLVSVTNLARCMKDLAKRGIWIYGTDADAEKSIHAIDFSGPVAIVMGGEGDGMRRLTRDSCDDLASLPMQGAVESLNVSVATGVVLFEVVRQRS